MTSKSLYSVADQQQVARLEQALRTLDCAKREVQWALGCVHERAQADLEAASRNASGVPIATQGVEDGEGPE